MNRERLQILREHLAGLPDERFTMSLWGAPEDRHTCKTACCVGGWTERLWTNQSAGAALGFTDEQHEALFYPEGWARDGRPLSDAIAAIDSMLASEDDNALPVWPSKEEA